MAGKDIFLKNGFQVIDERDRFQLVIYRLEEGPEPRFVRSRESFPPFKACPSFIARNARCCPSRRRIYPRWRPRMG
jgi:hypothetical protein